jgi:hypothetical protein
MSHLRRTFVHEEIELAGFSEQGRHELVPAASPVTLGRLPRCAMVVSGPAGAIGGRVGFAFHHDEPGGWRLSHHGHITAVLINGVRFADGSHRLVDGDELSFLTVKEVVAFTLLFVDDPPDGGTRM